MSTNTTTTSFPAWAVIVRAPIYDNRDCRCGTSATVKFRFLTRAEAEAQADEILESPNDVDAIVRFLPPTDEETGKTYEAQENDEPWRYMLAADRDVDHGLI